MMEFPHNQISFSKIPKSRVELHIHLDGSLRPSTVWDLACKKQLKIANCETLEELKQLIRIDKPKNLSYFLSKWAYFLHTVIGDKEAIERIAYELCEDEALDNVAYVEMRFSPQLMSNESCSPSDVVESVIRGVKRGEKEFGIKARLILCSIHGRPGWSKEVLSLAIKYQNNYVVGIDIAADENVDESTDGSCFDHEDVDTFKKAKELNINRTVHAGEEGPAKNVEFAIEKMYAQRIGHGYHSIDDDTIYQKCIKNQIHFETCPHSSYMTGSVKTDVKHPIVKFAEDGVSFSINKDDTTPIQKTLNHEYQLLTRLGLNEMHFVRANLNAARASFLPKHEKEQLLNHLFQVYGIKE